MSDEVRVGDRFEWNGDVYTVVYTVGAVVPGTSFRNLVSSGGAGVRWSPWDFTAPGVKRLPREEAKAVPVVPEVGTWWRANATSSKFQDGIAPGELVHITGERFSDDYPDWLKAERFEADGTVIPCPPGHGGSPLDRDRWRDGKFDPVPAPPWASAFTPFPEPGKTYDNTLAAPILGCADCRVAVGKQPTRVLAGETVDLCTTCYLIRESIAAVGTRQLSGAPKPRAEAKSGGGPLSYEKGAIAGGWDKRGRR